MNRGYISIIASLYDYMKPDNKSVLNTWLSQGRILSVRKEKGQYCIHLEHSDFVEEYNDKQYILHFRTVYDGWNKVPMLSHLEVRVDGVFKTVQEYNKGVSVL